MAKGPVVCLGIMVADLVGRPVATVPPPGSLSLVDEMGLYQGGCAVNAAAALVRLGVPAQVVGMLGDDLLGHFVRQALTSRGIGVAGVRVTEEAGTSATMVMVDPDGERRFIHYIGANGALTLDDIDFEMMRSAAIVHIAGALVMPGLDGPPMAQLLRRLQAANVVVTMDTAWDATGGWLDVLEPCLPHVDYFLPSLAEARALTGHSDPNAVAQALLDLGVGTVALTMGAAGCLVVAGSGDTLRQPAFAVDVVDATGAGDAFAAGFLAGLWHDWPLEETVRLASAVGALCVTEMGAEGGITSLAETQAFMETTPRRHN
ncbi:MAG: carbohydrate kinase family protein [Candidatus Promineifilaceae bacterium]|nr:carbohydrate kinase family protein [Candidatus Promineifilaceae bacterium]